MLNNFGKFLKEYHWYIITVLAIICVIISSIGFYFEYCKDQTSVDLSDLIYMSLQLFVLEGGSTYTLPNMWLQIGRFLAPALVATTTVILVILIFFMDQYKFFYLRLFAKKHIVICGLGYLGPEIAEYFLTKKRLVVIIESDPNNKFINSCKEKRAKIIIGDASDSSLLKKVQISQAEKVYLVTGNDAINADIAIQIQDIINSDDDLHNNQILTLHIHIVDQRICTVLRNHQYRTKSSKRLQWEFFNLYQAGGYCIQKAFPPSMSENQNEWNILVIGIGRMGETLIVQLARKWRDNPNNKGKKFSCSIIDRNAKEVLDLLEIRHPSLSKYCFITPLEFDLPDVSFSKGTFLFDHQGRCKFNQIYICFGDAAEGLSTALHLNQLLNNHIVPIIVRTTYLNGTTRLFKVFQEACSEYKHIYAFPLVSCRCCQDLIIHGYRGILARVIHDRYLEKRIKERDTENNLETLVEWNNLPDNYKVSNRDQADHIFDKIPMIGYKIIPISDWDEKEFIFTPEEIELLAKEEHKRWCREKRREGWKLGNEKNEVKKTTPHLIPYSELSEKMKDYDRDVVRNIPQLLKLINLQIVREMECNNEENIDFSMYMSICNGDA